MNGVWYDMQETIRQAATVLLVRDQEQEGQRHLHVYMTKRPETMRFLPGTFVFPGGQMETADSDSRLLARCTEVADALNPEGLPLAYWVTAVRETFEEAGVLLARDVRGNMVSPLAMQQARTALLAGEISLLDVLEQANLQLATDCMRYFGHRLTPRKVSLKRFDTRYFLTILPVGFEPIPDAREVVHASWYEAKDALQHWQAGHMPMVPPTVDCLRVLSRYQNVDVLWHSSEGVGKPTAEELA